MTLLRRLIRQLKKLNPYSKFAVKLGVFLMTCFYIFAAAAHLYAPHAKDYYRMLSIGRGCLEVAPAFLAVGACAGLLGDLMLFRHNPDDDSPGQD